LLLGRFDLREILDANVLAGRDSRFEKIGNRKGENNPDDGDHDKDFNESETLAPANSRRSHKNKRWFDARRESKRIPLFEKTGLRESSSVSQSVAYEDMLNIKGYYHQREKVVLCEWRSRAKKSKWPRGNPGP